jgi:hypothetical protein
MEIWISTTNAIDLLCISKQAFHKARLQRKYICRPVFDKGGIQYEVLLDSLPVDTQARYWADQTEAPDERDQLTDDEIYATAPEYARRKADKYVCLIKQSDGLTGDKLKQFIATWNSNNPDAKTSYPRLLDARKQYYHQGISALLGQWGKKSSSVPDDLFAFYKSLYLVQGRTSVQSCWKITLGHAKETGHDITNFPAAAAFDRRLKKEVPEQAMYTAREGAAAANRRYGFYIKRNYDDVLAGECWVSDHAQVDVAVTYKLNGKTKVCFPWVTVWRDFKSGKWLGWDLHAESPNSDHIFTAFHRAAVTFGVPSFVYLDNGKDYRCKDFAGGRNHHKILVDEPKTTSLCAALNITIIYAWPYNAQSKPVERDFLRNKVWFSQHNIGYRGGNVVERPENLNDVIASGKIMPIEDLDKHLSQFINDIAAESVVSSGHRKGQTPNEIWNEEYEQAIQKELVRFTTKEALMLFCCRTSHDMTISRRGIRDSILGVDYYGTWMEGLKGIKAYIRRDPKKMEDAWVFNSKNNEYLGQAYILPETPALARTDIEKRQLQQAIAIKRTSNRTHKILASADTDITFEQKMNALASVAKIINDKRQFITPVKQVCVPPVTATAMDRVIASRARKEKEGTQDLSILGVHRQKKEEKKKLFIWESDRDAATAVL